MPNIQKILTSLGLKEKEVQLYLLLLSLGSAPASVVGKRAGMPKSTARYLCLELAQKGFVALTHKGDVMYYTAEPPEKLLLLVEQQRWEMEQREASVRSIIEPLKDLIHPDSVLPRLRYFEGTAGLDKAWDEILGETPPGGEFLSFVHPLHPGDIDDRQPHLDRFMRKRVKKGITNRLLATDSPESRLLQKKDKEYLRETRIMRGQTMEHPTEIMLFSDKIYTLSIMPSATFASIMQNESAAAMQRLVFESLWEKSAA
jgi:sugar-specific transcriptional regulator TrmB